MPDSPVSKLTTSLTLLHGAASYDAVPYQGQPVRAMHPSSLAAVAQLLGVRAAHPARARVLELGCSDGGHLLPLAEQLPGSACVGIDYSPVQIAMGQRRVDALKLSNVTLRAMSIADVPPDFGEFDYILCHGVFSWVPDAVRDRILDVCATHLAPDGIAYISYNCYPGWHLRHIVRDMMRYHALRFPSAEKQLQESRLILDFIANAPIGRQTEGYADFLKSEAELLKKLPDHYLFHEHLEDHCNPYYFQQFVEMARKRGLDYLAESRLAAMAPTRFGADTERALAAIATDLIELEQFMDFLRSRTFRETLLHRPGASRVPDYALDASRLPGLYVASPLRPVAQPLDLKQGVDQAFKTHADVPVNSSNPLVKAAILCLALAYPASIEFDALVDQALGQLAKHKVHHDYAVRDRASGALGRALLTMYASSDAVEIRAVPSPFRTSVAERPTASGYARLQSTEHEPITTRRHESARLDETARAVLRLLDGTRTVSEVARELSLDEAPTRAMVEQLGRTALLV
jgi:SAM-dependent methyltransferase